MTIHEIIEKFTKRQPFIFDFKQQLQIYNLLQNLIVHLFTALMLCTPKFSDSFIL